MTFWKKIEKIEKKVEFFFKIWKYFEILKFWVFDLQFLNGNFFLIIEVLFKRENSKKQNVWSPLTLSCTWPSMRKAKIQFKKFLCKKTLNWSHISRTKIFHLWICHLDMSEQTVSSVDFLLPPLYYCFKLKLASLYSTSGIYKYSKAM